MTLGLDAQVTWTVSCQYIQVLIVNMVATWHLVIMQNIILCIGIINTNTSIKNMHNV